MLSMNDLVVIDGQGGVVHAMFRRRQRSMVHDKEHEREALLFKQAPPCLSITVIDGDEGEDINPPQSLKTS